MAGLKMEVYRTFYRNDPGEMRWLGTGPDSVAVLMKRGHLGT